MVSAMLFLCMDLTIVKFKNGYVANKLSFFKHGVVMFGVVALSKALAKKRQFCIV